MAVAAEVEELIDPDSRPAQLAPTMVTGSVWTRWESGLSPEEVLALVRDPLLDLQDGRTERTARVLARLSGLPLSLVNAAFGTPLPPATSYNVKPIPRS